MIAPPDSSSDTMLDALAVTLAALGAAADLDVDRNDEDRAAFAAERKALQTHYDALDWADGALRRHQRLVIKGRQTAIVIGDKVLDRGVRVGKAQMKQALNGSSLAAVDDVFPADINDIIGAEMKVEPELVVEAVMRLRKAADFAGRDALAADLEGRAKRQMQRFQDRADAEREEEQLWSALDKAIAAGSKALNELEKRLLERYPRDKVYVRAFFLDVQPTRKK